MKSVLEKIKQYLLVSNEQIGALVGLSGFTIDAVMAERREINGLPLLVLLKVYQAIEMEEKSDDEVSKNLTMSKQMYVLVHKKYTAIQQKLQKKQEILQQQQTRLKLYHKGLRVCQRLKAIPLEVGEQEWVKQREKELQYLLDFRASPLDIILLEAEIAGLQTQLNVLGQKLNE